jgi:hypothetical protein
MTDKISLVERMREFAKTHTDLPADWLEKADDFEAATTGFYSDSQTVDAKSFLGAWARARRLWCDTTGDPLI